MKNYDYYRDSWPAIVRGCYAHGGRMYLVDEQRDATGRVIRYVMGCELTEAEALEHRGQTIEICGSRVNENVDSTPQT